MADFMKCKKCREEYLDLGGSGYSACRRCGTMNIAERSKPRLTPTREWTCGKCQAEYSTDDASARSVCPECGHRNRNRAATVATGSMLNGEERYGARAASRIDWNAKAPSSPKKTVGLWIAFVLMIGTSYVCYGVIGMGWVGTVIISGVIWLFLSIIAAKLLDR